MDFKQIINQIGTIFLWIGVWNIINAAVQNNIAANCAIAMVGFFAWLVTAAEEQEYQVVEEETLTSDTLSV